ncbi:MAG: hypothetical protein WBB37_01395 [bacterium]
MLILIMIGVFETTLFPQNIFLEKEFNPTLENRERFQIVIGTGSKFQLPELRTYYLYSSLRSYRLSAHSFGNELYRENMLKLGSCFRIRKLWSVGFSVGLLNNWVMDNFNRFTYSLCLSSSFQTKNVKASGWVNNLNLPRLSRVDHLPLSYSIRFDYQTNNRFDFAFALRGMNKDLPFFNFGVIFSPYKIIQIGTAVNTEPLYLEYMIKLNVGDFILVYSGSNHQYLGLSHAFNLNFYP